ncbi:tetraacyldisaccharide 4'-kinase [Ideonella sp.]|uniref:tetraacyldisaccharide 4'-kinase n=1 Tax=Ideonella sp. TaxID=1929293 RepID=UPI0035B1BC3D
MSLNRDGAARLQAHWWQDAPGAGSALLRPLAWLYGLLARRAAAAGRRQARRPADRPVLVVGNLIVGGAGKTPTTLALIDTLRQAGWRPGVVSRGYGRQVQALVHVGPDTPVSEAGDEPLLIHRRTGVPVVVSRDRVAAGEALCERHPEVDLIVADDGLQHHRLARDVQVLVFDARGVGNGLLLPAGPLREPLPTRLPPHTLVLYNADAPSTPLPGACALRQLGGVQTLDEWWAARAAGAPRAARPVSDLRGRRLLAVAGIGEPERFFRMLEAHGLQVDRLPLPDHARLSPLPWPAGTPEVVLTEKDAVKLAPGAVPSGTRVWVATLDFALPPGFTDALLGALAEARGRLSHCH